MKFPWQSKTAPRGGRGRYARVTNRGFARRSVVETLEVRCLLAANQFAIVGDYGAAGASTLAVANLIKSWQPDFILSLGDNNYPIGAANTIDPNIGQYYHDFIGNYAGNTALYGPGSPTNRFFPVLGNVDWGTAGATPYLNYFTLPGNERYYDFVRGSTHFFAIDSDPAEPDGTTANSIQGQWLKNALAQSTSLYNVVYFHHPAYTSGNSHPPETDMQWPFKAWGADVVLSGHNHNYERLEIDGLTFFVNGVGGRSLNGFNAVPAAGSQVRYFANYGAMRATINAESLTFEFYSITGGGTLIDRIDLTPNGVQDEHVFYNDSVFDRNKAAADADDDLAIATDKHALLPGGTATLANYTSYNRGLNGLMIDVVRPPAALTVSDFEFRVGNENSPQSWPLLGQLPTVSVRSNFTPGVDRVTLVWPDDAIRNQWLQVTVKRTAATGLPAPHVVYFGNAVGESGNLAGNATVDANDEVAARNNPHTFVNPAAVDDLRDFNRDGFVNAADQILARSNATSVANVLKLIMVPGGALAIASPSPMLAAALDSRREQLSTAPQTIQTSAALPASVVDSSLADDVDRWLVDNERRRSFNAVFTRLPARNARPREVAAAISALIDWRIWPRV